MMNSAIVIKHISHAGPAARTASFAGRPPKRGKVVHESEPQCAGCPIGDFDELNIGDALPGGECCPDFGLELSGQKRAVGKRLKAFIGLREVRGREAPCNRSAGGAVATRSEFVAGIFKNVAHDACPLRAQYASVASREAV